MNIPPPPEGFVIQGQSGSVPPPPPGFQLQQPPAQRQSDTASPSPGLRPGTREYAQWAAEQARAGNALPQVSAPPRENQSSILDPLAQGMTMGWGDEIASAMHGAGAMMQ